MDIYESWLGIPADRRPPTFYDLLGLAPFESDADKIERAALRRMARVRHYQIGQHSDESQAILNELSRARVVLLDSHRRAEYAATLGAEGVYAPVRPDLEVGKANGESDADAGLPGDPGLNIMPDADAGQSLSLRSSLSRRSPAWKKCLNITIFFAPHVALLWAFFTFGPRVGEWVWGKPRPAPPVVLPLPQTSSEKTTVASGPPNRQSQKKRASTEGMRFDGKTFIAVDWPNVFEMWNSDFTIFARVKSEGDGPILSQIHNSLNDIEGKAFFIRGGKPSFDFCGEGERKSLISTGRVSDGQWHDVALVVSQEPALTEFFVDGAKVSHSPESLPASSHGNSLWIGFTGPGYPPKPSYFVGWISEVRLYERALSRKEVAALENEQLESDGLAARWVLRPGMERTVGDQSGQNHDGTIELNYQEVSRKIVIEKDIKAEADEQIELPARNAKKLNEERGPEGTLKKCGLHIVGSLCVLDAEEAALEAAKTMHEAYQELQGLHFQQQATASVEQRQQVIVDLQTGIFDAQTRIDELNRANDQIPRPGGRFANSDFREQSLNLRAQKVQFEEDQRQASALLNRLKNEAFDPQARPRIDAAVLEAKAAYESKVRHFRALVDKTTEEYKALKDNPVVQKAIEQLARDTKRKLRLDKSPSFARIERIAKQKARRGLR